MHCRSHNFACVLCCVCMFVLPCLCGHTCSCFRDERIHSLFLTSTLTFGYWRFSYVTDWVLSHGHWDVFDWREVLCVVHLWKHKTNIQQQQQTNKKKKHKNKRWCLALDVSSGHPYTSSLYLLHISLFILFTLDAIIPHPYTSSLYLHSLGRTL